MSLRGRLSLAAMLGIQSMFGNFGATDDPDRVRATEIRGVGKPGKNRQKKTHKNSRSRHRRTYTHGKSWARV